MCEVSNICNTIESINAELKVIDLNVDAGIDNNICDNAQLQAIITSNHPQESRVSSSF